VVAISSYEAGEQLGSAAPRLWQPTSAGAAGLRRPARLEVWERHCSGPCAVQGAGRRANRTQVPRRVPSALQLSRRWGLVLFFAGTVVTFLALGVGRAASVLSGPSSLRACALGQPAAGAPSCSQIYVARPGDTIWAVASKFGRGGDPRLLADQLEAEIGGGVLQPGQRLSVP
jgi:hypothetical protein